MTRLQKLAFITLGLSFFPSAVCGEENPETPPPARAVWIEPALGQAPWLDLSQAQVPMQSAQILASGPNRALIKINDGRMFVVDESFKSQTPVTLPDNAQWMGFNGQDQLLVWDGTQILAGSLDENADQISFVPVLNVPNARVMDCGLNTLVYADESGLNLVDLSTGALKRIALADFFDDEKIAQMTPEAVQKAEDEAAKAAKKNRKSSKKSTVPQPENETKQVADILGIWWRNDNTGIVRVRSLMNVRTFVTADGGRSWVRMAQSPENIQHSFGLIWDGESQVLSQNGQEWMCISGQKYAPTDRYLMTHELAIQPKLPKNWTNLSSPETTANPEKPECVTQDGELPCSEPVQSTSCVEMPVMLSVSAHASKKQTISDDYAPKKESLGLQMGLYSDSTCMADSSSCTAEYAQKPTAWMIEPGGTLQNLELPANCMPRYVGSQAGLGIALCEESKPGMLTVYTRVAQSDWLPETQLPSSFAQNTRIYASDDGTILLLGMCHDESLHSADASLGNSSDSVKVCQVAVRQPFDVGYDPAKNTAQISQNPETKAADESSEPTAKFVMPELWRVERVENSTGVVPISGGRLLTLEGRDPNTQKLVLRTPQKTETLVDAFDPTPYHGLVSTDEGCFALYDGQMNPEVLRTNAANPDGQNGQNPPVQVKLLSTEGRLAELDCASSRAIAELSPNADDAGDSTGDDRYGLRVGGGGFFTMNDVQTWFMRIEGLIPVYGGAYEVGIMYRMGGGNKSNVMGHLGLVDIRWRYDGLELFDFAVGAGLGYGSMCGYDKKSDKNAMDDDDSTEPSGFARCSTYSIRYLISGIATYKLSSQWKIFLGLELLGGSNWGFDLSGGIEVRF